MPDGVWIHVAAMMVCRKAWVPEMKTTSGSAEKKAV